MQLDNERNDSKSRINNKTVHANAEYKRLWSTSKAENNRLRNEINSLRSDLESANRQLNSAFQESARNSGSDTEKSEKKAMEKKLTEIKEEIKLLTLSGNLTSQIPVPSSCGFVDQVSENKQRSKVKRARVKRKRKSEYYWKKCSGLQEKQCTQNWRTSLEKMHQIAANVAHFTMIATAIVIIYTNLHNTYRYTANYQPKVP